MLREALALHVYLVYFMNTTAMMGRVDVLVLF